MEQFKRETAVFGIHLTNRQLDQFRHYRELLLVWNQQLNLTAIRDPRQIERRHFLDALTCATVMGRLADCSLIDVGTGAGFPGLPLKILYPSLRLTLVESIAKKARFLEVVTAELGLSDVFVAVERAEVLGRDARFREQYDWAVARAVAELRILVEYLLPFCRVGGHMLAQKGGSAAVESEAAREAIALLGGAPPQQYPIQLPQREETHFLVVSEKRVITPAKYPRRTGVPAKRPL